MKRIKIELCSDLCAADGDGFGSVIDTDICTDKFGIPYIPAKRLKGVLRDAAVYIEANHIDEIFGITGDSKSGLLKISDAVLENIESIESEISKKHLNPKTVTELFTSVKASTAINENGSAQANSLRFTRVLENSLPWDRKSKIVFFSDVEIPEYEDDFYDICKAMRHIGYKRNRGFGVVKCSLVDSKKSKNNFSFSKCSQEKTYVLNYAVKNTDTLMIPGKGVNLTQDYISGTSVMGLLGQAYLKNNNGNIDDQFRKIFMNNDVKFSNLYVTDEELNEYIPVPGVFAKDKTDETKRIHNLVTEKTEGKILKPLKDGYINSQLKVKKAETEIVYHNNLSSKGQGLYTQTCLSKGQYFRGSITADGETINILADLLIKTDIRFGRSKTAQYSKCELEAFEITELKNDKIKVSSNVMFILESDVILRDETGTVSSNPAVLINALGIDINQTEIHRSSNIKYHTVSGFNTSMRMQRPHERVFAAGTVIVCSASGKEFDSVIYIGEKLNEGFGKVRIFDAQNFLNNSRSLNKKREAFSDTAANINKLANVIKQQEDMRSEAIKYAKDNYRTIRSLTPSAIGRITLMTEEASNLNNLKNRLNSIRIENTRKNAIRLINNAHAEHYVKEQGWEKAREYLIIILAIAKYMKKQGEWK
ncbi:RAMP superfamily CRISPR-associated protein [Ruminococcus sp. HUN007]|uniref:RAMP superfamily CRISPR-associated protein n=1 Tax=Ruminococcus sp. HUN007 TaxID=1514668 RepID=UPI0005D2C6DE|nr:RAMP superfamily CRISPR-associated protein [Ruminococcus sp. HUN007]